MMFMKVCYSTCDLQKSLVSLCINHLSLLFGVNQQVAYEVQEVAANRSVALAVSQNVNNFPGRLSIVDSNFYCK